MQPRLTDIPFQMAVVLPSVEKLVRKVCAAQNAAGGSFGARVLSVYTGKEVSS